MNPTDLQTFVIAAQAGSLSAAARRLNVPKSTVGRRVRRLETELDVSLFDRTSNRTRLTDAGELLCARAGPAFDLLTNAGAEIRGLMQEPRGSIRITALGSLGEATFLTQAFLEYQQRCPHVTVEFDPTERMVDLYEHGVDLALRPITTKEHNSSDIVVERNLGPIQGHIYGSPAYVEANGPISAVSDLSPHVTVGHDPVMRNPLMMYRNHKRHRIVLDHVSLWSTSFGQLLHAALAGETLGLLPAFLGEPEVLRGGLIRLLPEWRVEGAALGIIRPSRRIILPKIRIMIDVLTEAMLDSGVCLSPTEAFG